jgi:hypothetical protein
VKDRHLITVDELREAGALDVPEAWKKSLGEDKHLFSDADDEENSQPKKRKRSQLSTDKEAPAIDSVNGVAE